MAAATLQSTLSSILEAAHMIGYAARSGLVGRLFGEGYENSIMPIRVVMNSRLW